MPADREMPTYELTTVQQAVEIGTSLSLSWFRGHSKCYAELTPSVFRTGLINQPELPEAIADRAGTVEAFFVDGFRLKAPSVEANLPQDHDHLAWLFVMQHHRTPTRLLDWSENVLIAMYFAVRDDEGESGEFWAINPASLAMAAGLPAIPAHNSIIVKYLAAQAIIKEPDHVAAVLGYRYTDEGLLPVPIYPPLVVRRMVSQSSVFTIHPKPRPGNSILDLLRQEEYLVRYVIPADRKAQLLRDLMALGVNELTMFPDLDGLSAYLRQELVRPQWRPVAPPRWDHP
jgi:hypothetical protein